MSSNFYTVDALEWKYKFRKAHGREVSMIDLIERILILEKRVFELEKEVQEHEHLSNACIGNSL